MKWTIMGRSESGLIVSDGARQYDVALDEKYISRLAAAWTDSNCIGKQFDCDTSDPKMALDVQAGAQRFSLMMTTIFVLAFVIFFLGIIAGLYFVYLYILAGNIWQVVKIIGVIVVAFAVIGVCIGGRREDYGPRNNP